MAFRMINNTAGIKLINATDMATGKALPNKTACIVNFHTSKSRLWKQLNATKQFHKLFSTDKPSDVYNMSSTVA